MLKICLVFWKYEPQYAYKKNVCHNYETDGDKTAIKCGKRLRFDEDSSNKSKITNRVLNG